MDDPADLSRILTSIPDRFPGVRSADLPNLAKFLHCDFLDATQRPYIRLPLPLLMGLMPPRDIGKEALRQRSFRGRRCNQRGADYCCRPDFLPAWRTLQTMLRFYSPPAEGSCL